MNRVLILCLIISCYLIISINCINRNICELPRKVGPCRGMFRSYYYNSSSNQCEEFYYGGCDGNENRFKSNEECNKQCVNGKIRKG